MEELEDVPHSDKKMQRTVENDRTSTWTESLDHGQSSQGQKQRSSGF